MAKKILIGVPSHDMIPAAFAQSLCMVVEYMLSKKYNIRTQFYEGTLISTARQKLVDIAIKDKADYLFFLDSDMIVPHNIIEWLLNDDCDVVSPMFFKRTNPYQPCFYTSVDVSDPAEPVFMVPTKWPDKGIIKCDATGLACTLIKSSVLTSARFDSGVAGLGEDVAFCLNAREQGFEVYVDTRVEAGHIGRIVVTEKTYKEANK